jgi:hypothetical protein
MRKLVMALAIGLFLVATSLFPVARQAAASVGVEVGDYWRHTFSVDEMNISMDGTLKMKVDDTEGSGATEVFVVETTGSGEFVGVFEGSSVNGDFEMSGFEKRLVSNFSLVSISQQFEMVMKAAGQSVSLKIGTAGTYSPALDDYVLDNNPGLGGTLVSRSTLTVESWFEMELLGIPQNDTTTITEQVTVTQQVASSNETVNVPAGTYECYKVTVTEIGTETGTDTMTYYYSDVVGNYVKTVGSSSELGDIGDTQLKSYSYMGRGSATSSLFSGAILLIIIVVIVVVLVVVSLVLMMRKRGKAVTPMPMQTPPPDMGVPPPPPPGA